MRPKLIGVAGYARVGKSSVGNILEREFGYEQRAFADKVRELAYETSEHYRSIIDTHGYEDGKVLVPYVREHLVRVGAGARRVLGGDVWLDACLPADRFSEPFCEYASVPVAVTDVRYANEALRIRQLGGEIWMVQRPGVLPANAEEEMSIPLVPVDRFIYNNGSLEDLEIEVRHAVDA